MWFYGAIGSGKWPPSMVIGLTHTLVPEACPFRIFSFSNYTNCINASLSEKSFRKPYKKVWVIEISYLYMIQVMQLIKLIFLQPKVPMILNVWKMQNSFLSHKPWNIVQFHTCVYYWPFLIGSLSSVSFIKDLSMRWLWWKCYIF